MKDKNKVFLSWEWVKEQINIIGDKLESHEIEFVAGIPRGGLIPAVMVSHAFGFKYISYSSAKMLPGELRSKTLIIDDISDTGATLKEPDKLGFLTSTLCVRVGTQLAPTFTGTTFSHDDWLVFPWENLNGNTIQDYLVDSE